MESSSCFGPTWQKTEENYQNFSAILRQKLKKFREFLSCSKTLSQTTRLVSYQLFEKLFLSRNILVAGSNTLCAFRKFFNLSLLLPAELTMMLVTCQGGI